MDDVAARAQVSRATVSRVLMGTTRVSEHTRQRVHTALRELGYVPNMIARGLAGGRSDLVGLLLRSPANPSYGLLYSEIQAQAVRCGLQLITVAPAASEASDGELAGLHRLLGLRVGGLIIATGVIRSVDLEPFLDAVPVVSVGRVEEHQGIYGVSYDEDTNAAIVAAQVAAAGHRSIAVVIPALSLSAAENRRGLGMAAHLEGRGLTVHRLEATRFETPVDRYDDVVALNRQGRATAALFTSDRRALGFLDHAETCGLQVPTDISVTGFDAITPGLNRIGLASLRIPVARVAERGAAVMTELLSDRMNVPVRHERYAGEFVPGRSLAAPADR